MDRWTKNRVSPANGPSTGNGKVVPEHSAGAFNVVVSPVPSYYDFTVHLQQGDPAEKVRIRVYDQVGRLVEGKDQLSIGAKVTIGSQYAKGYYTLGGGARQEQER